MTIKKEQNYQELQDKAKEYIKKFEKAATFNNARMDAYAELMAFYQGNQHLLKTQKKKQPWVVNMNTPYSAVAIDNRVSSLIATDYVGEILPLAPEDVDSIESLMKLYRKEWERLNLDYKVRDSIKTGAIVREGYIHIYYDPKKIKDKKRKKRVGDLEAYHLEPAQVYIDPNSRKMSEAEYIFVAGRISKERAEATYPVLKDIIPHDDQSNPERRGEVYVDNDYTTEQEGLYSVLTCYEKGDTGTILRTKLIAGVIVSDTRDMGIKHFPIAQFRWKKAAQSCYGLSLMDDVLALQKALSSIDSAITNTAIAYAAPSMLLRKGSGLDPETVSVALGAPGVVYTVEGDLDNALKPVIPPRIEDTILGIKADFEHKIDKITGNSSQFLGDIGTAGATSGGTKVAVERARIIEIDVLSNIGEFVEDLTTILIDYIMLIYAGETLNVYDGKAEDGISPAFMEITMPEESKLKDLQYKYYIKLDSKTPYSKERQKELLLDIFQLERQYDAPVKTITITDIIRNSDLENKEEIINRFNDLNKQDAETKAQAITSLLTAGLEVGLPQELLLQAIAELISGQNDTPALRQVMDAIEQSVQQEMAFAEEQAAQVDQALMENPLAQEEMLLENEGILE